MRPCTSGSSIFCSRRSGAGACARADGPAANIISPTPIPGRRLMAIRAEPDSVHDPLAPLQELGPGTGTPLHDIAAFRLVALAVAEAQPPWDVPLLAPPPKRGLSAFILRSGVRVPRQPRGFRG